MAAEHSGLYFMFLAPPPPPPSEVSGSATDYGRKLSFETKSNKLSDKKRFPQH